MRDDAKPEQPYTRLSAYTFLLVGYVVSVGLGLVIGWHAQEFLNGMSVFFHHVEGVQSNMFYFSSTALLIPDLVVYPPIAVLIVDTMHAVTSRID